MRLRLYILAITSLILNSCFTGIESTPKIKYDDSDIEKSSIITHEQKILSDIKNESFCNWEIGKEFIVCDNKISLIFSTHEAIDSLEGSVIKYLGHSTSPSVTGTTNTDIYFSHNNSDTLSYHVNFSPQEINNNNSFDIPFTIQKSVVDAVSNKILNKKYYIITSSIYDSKGDNTIGQKFIPVTITDIKPGNFQYPIKVIFTNEQGKSNWVYMTIGNGLQSTRNFETIFSLSNPREKYPKITDTNWEYITKNIVTQGMTKEECRLALGVPISVDRRPTYAGVVELWIYDYGTQLIFEDGLLKEFKR